MRREPKEPVAFVGVQVIYPTSRFPAVSNSSFTSARHTKKIMFVSFILPLVLIVSYAAQGECSHAQKSTGRVSVTFVNNCDRRQEIHVKSETMRDVYTTVKPGRKKRITLCNGDSCVPQVPLAHEFTWESATSLPCTETMTVSGTKPYVASMKIFLPCERVEQKPAC